MTNKHVAVIIATYKTVDLTIDCLHSIDRERAGVDLLIAAKGAENSSVDYNASNGLVLAAVAVPA